MPVVFDARTISPHYPGVGRYGQGLLAALAVEHARELCVIHGPGQDLAGLVGVEQVALPTRVRSPLDQLAAPRRLARRPAGPGEVYHSPFYIFPYRLPLPKVVTLYDLTPLRHPQGFSAAVRLLYRAAHRLAIGHARRIITLSSAARDDFVLQLGAAAEKIVVIPPGHTRVQAAPALDDLPDAYLLYVGINKPHKNLVRLVEAYSRLDAAPPLLIAGPLDPRFPEAQAVVERTGLQKRVAFLGRVSDAELAGLYARATLFVFPSLAEGFGFPVLEAMGHGTPVACSDLPVLREVGGEAALYFNAHSAPAIAAVLREALADKVRRCELGRLGLRRAAAYTWERAAAQTWQVYETAARP